MALQLGALHDAPIEAGASSDAASKAAEEGASFERRLSSVEARLPVLTRLVSANMALTAAALFKLL